MVPLAGTVTRIAGSDEDTRTALAGLIMLADINRGDGSLSKSETDDLTKRAPDLIPYWVPILNAWRIGQHLASQPPTPHFGKVGRNDPCPCGFGKKYKKCAITPPRLRTVEFGNRDALRLSWPL